MKYLITATAFIFGVISIYSCGKLGLRSDKFICDVASSDFPANDTGWVFAPNAFSPNGDGTNDVYQPKMHYCRSIQWSVYDQDNRQLYTTTDSSATWSPSGNSNDGIKWYQYKVTAVSNQGNSFNQCGSICSITCMPDDFDGFGGLVFGDQYDPAAPRGYLKSFSRDLELTNIPCK